MTVENQELQSYLQDFDFTNLLVDGMGWDYPHTQPQIVTVDDFDYTLTLVAQKREFGVWRCGANEDGEIPIKPIRRKIENQVAKLNFEHIIIFVDADETAQVWQWVKRERGHYPAFRERQYTKGQSGDSLLQTLRLLTFDWEDEKELNTSKVTSRVRDAMDVERVTRRFYTEFRRQLTEFQSFIDGIDDLADKEWYASIMLNRMMFIYFIQRQGFMDGDPKYLRNRLDKIQKNSFGNGHRTRFQDFYRVFLLRLFHEGLGQPENERDAELVELLGKVPFLNGGLFDVYDLECRDQNISIPDKAFRKLFDFFDQYRWHLDDRPNRDDNEINPDVLGYIFEKYINQKQMGAYYTKEDITGYISRNTVIPFLFDAAKKSDHIAFSPEGGVWPLLQNDPDRYIYPAVGHGISWYYSSKDDPKPLENPIELPDYIVAGIDDVSKRDGWNTPAPEQYALPTETWREVIARRQRYFEISTKLAAGEIQDINDLITLNLDVERFTRDIIKMSEGPDLVRAFWKAVSTVSVLDPTCGSGAFLFAALNILEPIYTACINGMQGFVDDLEITGRPYHSQALSDFKRTLDQVDRHPNTQYYILKSIVLNNLYGVDIMPEAVEICKLRLFLKLAAQLKNDDHMEPLPDIDFNIRAGNTLVGFTSLDAVRSAMRTVKSKGEDQGKMMSEDEKEILARIEEDARIANQTFDNFRRQQTWLNGELTTVDKNELSKHRHKLRKELDRYLASEYCIDPDDDLKYENWRDSHKPFHWWVEFYGIMNKGGFDVIIGNPPYVEYRTVRDSYSTLGLATVNCGNLYAMTWERSLDLASKGYLGMIVPASAVCTDGYAPLRNLLTASGTLFVSSYSDNPGKLFDGLPHNRLQIILVDKGSRTRRIFSSVYNKWRPEGRDSLFQVLSFFDSTDSCSDAGVAKIGHTIEASILRKVSGVPLIPQQSTSKTEQFPLYYTRKLSHFVQILNFIPKIQDLHGNPRKPSELKEVRFENQLTRDGLLGLMNSSLFSWLVAVFSDCRNLNQREIKMIRFDVNDQHTLERLATVTNELMLDIKKNSQVKKQGHLVIQQTFPRMSKHIIDKIDRILAEHYGFTDEELDFIINYDIKYRMGIK